MEAEFTAQAVGRARWGAAALVPVTLALGACVIPTPPDDVADSAVSEVEIADTVIGRAPPVEAPAHYRCGDLDVLARFPDTASVELVADGIDERLPRVPAGSGVKYEAGVDASYRLFWTKGNTARLALGSDAWWACERLDPDVPEGH